MELHVPRPSTEHRPAITYSCQDIRSPIAEHPLAKQLPQATDGPSIQPGPQEFREFNARADAPAILKDYLVQDVPVLSLHITSFSDATLVALSWPHVIMDVMGQQVLLRGWSLVLAGRETDLPPLLGAREDVLLTTPEISHQDVERMKLSQKRLAGLAFAAFGARFVWDMLWHPVVETKTIFLPSSAVNTLRQQAESDLGGGDGSGKSPFVSDGDILTAWGTHLIASSLPQPRPITIINPMNARFRLPELANSNGVFVQNMALAALTFLSPQDACGPMGKIALENRRQLLDQATPKHIHAFLQDLRSQPQDRRDPSMPYGDPGTVLVPMTNWSKADIFNTVDFSPAVIDSHQSKDSRAGRLVYHHSCSMQTNASVRNVVVVLGKDHEQNYWLTAMLLPETWAKVEAAIARL